MMKTSLIAGLFVAAAAGAAQAGGQAGSIGVGAEYQLSGAGGVSMNADQGDFHVGGFLGFADPEGPRNTEFTVGGRFFWHVHSTTTTDFGVGGGVGYASVYDTNMMGTRSKLNEIFIEPSFQIRVFIAANVALSATGGVIIGVDDASGVGITGQSVGTALNVGGIGLSGGLGIHYYFFSSTQP